MKRKCIYYTSSFRDLWIESNSEYPRNDIGVAQLFYDLHSGFIRYVMEAKTWFVYSGRHWFKDEVGFRVMERCKDFAQSYAIYAKTFEDGTLESKEFSKYSNSTFFTLFKNKKKWNYSPFPLLSHS